MMKLGLKANEIQEIKRLLPKKLLKGITYRLIIDAPELIKEGYSLHEEAFRRYHAASQE